MAYRHGFPPSPVTRHPSQPPASPRTGTASAPVNHVFGSPSLSLSARDSPTLVHIADRTPSSPGRNAVRQLSSSSIMSSPTGRVSITDSSLISPGQGTRPRSRSRDTEGSFVYSPRTPTASKKKGHTIFSPHSKSSPTRKKYISDASEALAKARGRNAQKENDSMVYLDGPQVYTCGQCRTHLTSHDDIISKSFHGRHGRAYLFDQCVNITVGPAEDRLLITGLHSVCDIFCKRCKGMIGWTYAKAYESSQKYKEGKFIIEKINLHLEESDYYDVSHPAGERPDKWRRRAMSWGSDTGMPLSPRNEAIVYEYKLPDATSSLPNSPRYWGSSKISSERSSYVGEGPLIRPQQERSGTSADPPPAPPLL